MFKWKEILLHILGALGSASFVFGILLMMSNAGAKYCNDGKPMDIVWPWFAIFAVSMLVCLLLPDTAEKKDKK